MALNKVPMVAPTAPKGTTVVYATLSGTTYRPDSNNQVQADPRDVLQLLQAGFTIGTLNQSASGGVTPFSGGGQASATPLTSEVNRISSTVATVPPYDSVSLPPATAGLITVVINATMNPIQVFGSANPGSDTINGVAGNVGIKQFQNSIDFYVCGTTGQWSVESGEGFSGQLVTELGLAGITANIGGGQANATQLADDINRVNTVTNPGDSVKLPSAAAGLDIVLINHGNNAMQVFGLGNDTIDDQPSGTGVSQMAQSMVIYSCANAGFWYSNGLATGFGGPGLQTMSWSNNLTAHVGGGQASGLPLISMLNRITTSGVGGTDSVDLPASVAGMTITVINRTANPIQVFGAASPGTDTINGVAAGTGISQPANSIYTYISVLAGAWEVDPVGGFSGQLPTSSAKDGIAAFATGGQASATLLNAVINRITTVTNIGDSVKLPPSAPGLMLQLANAAANSANVFPNTGDQINALGANNAFALAGGKNATFFCTAAGQWHSILSA